MYNIIVLAILISMNILNIDARDADGYIYRKNYGFIVKNTYDTHSLRLVSTGIIIERTV